MSVGSERKALSDALNSPLRPTREDLVSRGLFAVMVFREDQQKHTNTTTYYIMQEQHDARVLAMGRKKAAEKLATHLNTRIDRERLEQRGTLKSPPLSRKEQVAEDDRKDRARKGLERTLLRQLDDNGKPRLNPWAQVEESQAEGQEEEEENQQEDLNAPITREGLRELATEVKWHN